MLNTSGNESQADVRLKELRADLERGFRSGSLLPSGWIGEGAETLKPQPEYWRGTLGPGTALLVGPSSAGKTSLTVGLGLALASGSAFFGRDILEPVGVAHLLGEGAAGVPRRYAALRINSGIRTALPIAWTVNTRNLLDHRQRRAVITDLERVNAHFQAEHGVPLRCVFVDTLSTNFQFRDENDNAAAAAAITAMQEIATAVGGLCLAVHHPPKSGVGERGGGALRGGADFILTAGCDRDDATGIVKNRQLALTKTRDGEAGPISGFDLQRIALGILDFYGQEISSVVAVPTLAPLSRAGVTTSRRESVAVRALRSALDEALVTDGRKHVVHVSPNCESPSVTAVPLDIVRREFYRRWAVDEADPKKRNDAQRQALKRAIADSASTIGREVFPDGSTLMWRL